MNKTWSDAIGCLSNHGFNQVADINLDLNNTQNETPYYFIRHRFKDIIIVPYVGITDNIGFLREEKPKCITGDNVKCIAYNIEEKSIFSLENEIQQLYKITAWNFLKVWDNQNLGMNSLTMIKMNLKKIE